MSDIKNEIYKLFKDNNITSREELRTFYFEQGHKFFYNRTLLEGFFVEYKKELAGTNEVSKTIKVVSISDLHVPFQNKKMVKNFISLCSDEQPDEIILNGDIVDFYDLSSFDKNPERVNCLQEELDEASAILKALRRACPSAKIIYILGNHEDRLRRFLWKNPQLSSLRALKFEELMRLKKLNIQLAEDSYTINGFKYKHGSVVRQHSSYSAKAEFDHELCSGESGHTHRIGTFCKTAESGVYGWFESGCGCDLTPEYIAGTPNWQNSFTVRYFDDNAFDTHQVYVHKGRFRFNGKVY